MPESGLQAAERLTAERPTAESQILSDTGDLSGYRSKWTKGGELPVGYEKLALFTQPVPNGLEVAVVESVKAPRKSELEEIWRKRKGGRASPVLVVAVPAGAVAMPAADTMPPADTATLPANTVPPADTSSLTSRSAATLQFTLCGLEKQASTICQTLPPEQVQILLANALATPDHHSATNYLASKLQQLQDIPGLRNQGLLATHELQHGVPERPDWDTATQKALAILQERDENLLTSLGFSIEPHDERINILTAGNRRTAVAVSLRRGEPFDLRSSQHSLFEISPVATAAQVAERNNLNWMILTRGPEIRLYSSKAEVGVGSGTREEKYLELDLEYLPENQAGYLHLLFSADALSEGGSLHETVSNSSQFATELAARLRDRVYDKTVPLLAEAVARQISGDPSERSLEDAYEQVMLILFRLLFVAYGEAKDLLPLRSNTQYQNRSLTEIAKLMLDNRNNNLPPWDSTQTTLWPNVVQLWEAIDKGNSAWGVPAYNGGLFSTDPDVSPPGAAIAQMRPLADEEFGPALEALLIDETPDGGPGLVDFRSLSVREFGTIYEGLLESRFSAAPTDLTLNKKNLFVPAEQGEMVAVPEGGVYFHNRSGARKSSGSYFTKAFAVNHLIDHALVPALENHTETLDALLKSDGPEAAAKAFFEFRCADIAMGSGHFLTAALDKIVEVLSKYMDEHQLPQITDELDNLRATSEEALGDSSQSENITYEALLRRQVARRCIYGVDKHAVAVELAQVALWIHTFIPGLPLSNLARNLVCGDSLTGVGSVDEVVQALEPDYSPDKPSLYRQQIEGHLNAAKDAWEKMAANPEATIEDVEESRQLSTEMAEKVRIATMQFDLVSASRAGVIDIEGFDEDTIKANRTRKEVKDALDWLRPAHFPALFPEVFWGDNPGFDCLLGNPPWEKATVEKHAWWCQHALGIRALPVGKMNQAISELAAEQPHLAEIYEREVEESRKYAEVLKNGSFDLGKGNTDLYQAFSWRFWQLAGSAGSIGVVLPRSALQGKGSEPWRKEILDRGTFSDVSVLLNNSGWVFEDIHFSYTITLCSIQKNLEESNALWFNGPIKSEFAFKNSQRVKIPINEFREWSNSCAFPNIPSSEALKVFQKFHLSSGISAISTKSIMASAPTIRPDHPPRPSAPTIRPDHPPRPSAPTIRPDHPPRPSAPTTSSCGASCDTRQTSFRPRPVREIDATGDKYWFTDMTGQNYWPVYSGRSFNIWEPDTGEYYAWADPEPLLVHLHKKRLSQSKTSTSAFFAADINWLNNPETLPCLSPRIAFRDTTNPTNARTSIACLVPPNVFIAHQAPYLLFFPGEECFEAFWLGIMCATPFDWYTRRVVELHLTFDIFNSCPVPDFLPENDLHQHIIHLAGRLAAVDDRYGEWAEQVGVEVASVKTEEEKADLIAELDAAVALLYGLDESDIHVIYDTFHRTIDHLPDINAVLGHYRNLR